MCYPCRMVKLTGEANVQKSTHPSPLPARSRSIGSPSTPADINSAPIRICIYKFEFFQKQQFPVKSPRKKINFFCG
jgi:hypothetical protein